jgi:hypothetical protein
VRDFALRQILNDEINRRLDGTGRDADTFTEADLKRMLKDGPFRMPSSQEGAGVPIKRVILLWTVNDPVRMPLREFDFQKGHWTQSMAPDSERVYQGDDNHHIEIRENDQSEWSGKIIRTFDAAQRVRVARREAVDRSDDLKGGRFVMSLAEGETVYMRHKDTKQPGYFVVFKLDKPHTVQFKWHWDARRAKGEKDEDGELMPNSQREPMPVTALQLKDLAPPGETTPIKVSVDPLGKVRRLEPAPERKDDTANLDARVLAIAREAMVLRGQRNGDIRLKRSLPGSWKWMKARLAEQCLDGFGPQLSSAIRALQGDNAKK